MATGRLPDPNTAPLTAKGDLYTYSTVPAKLAVGNNGETLVADSSASTGLRWQGNFAAGKNKIINGDFGIWQRGTSFTVAPATGSYTADRFLAVNESGANLTASRQTFTPGSAPVAGYEGQFYCRYVSTSATGDVYNVQKIEDVRTFAGQTVTVSFWARCSSGTVTSNGYYVQGFGSGGSSTVFANLGAITITTSWQRFTQTVAIPSVAGKTIGAGSSLDFQFVRYAASATVDFFGAQVEAGSVATAFQTATGTLAGELQACQRYYWRSPAGSAEQKFAQGPAYASGYAISNPITLGTPMRVKPTAIDYGGTIWLQRDASQGGSNITALGLMSGYSNTTQIVLDMQVASGLTAGTYYELKANGSSTAYIGLSAEL